MHMRATDNLASVKQVATLRGPRTRASDDQPGAKQAEIPDKLQMRATDDEAAAGVIAAVRHAALEDSVEVFTSRFGRRAAAGAKGYENLPVPTALSNDTKPPLSVPPDEYAHEDLATVDAATTQLRQRIIDAKSARSSRRPPYKTVPLPAAVSLLTGWIPPILVRVPRAR